MAKQGNGGDEPTLGGALQSLFVAGVRMSAGFALYGLEQIGNIAEAVRGDGIAGAAERLGSAFDRLSDSMEGGIDDTKKEALRSVSRVTAKAVEKYAEVLSPAAIAEAANKFLLRTGRPALRRITHLSWRPTCLWVLPNRNRWPFLHDRPVAAAFRGLRALFTKL